MTSLIRHQMNYLADSAISVAFVVVALILSQSPSLATDTKTLIQSKADATKLLGNHMLSLQWISWDDLKKAGRVTVTESGGTYSIKGEQKGQGKERGSYVKVDGIVTEIGIRKFKIRGTILTRVSHLNGGNECKREGDFNFSASQNRKYWRLQEMKNPCDEATDYVDIFF
jgi:hypothetical protein